VFPEGGGNFWPQLKNNPLEKYFLDELKGSTGEFKIDFIIKFSILDVQS
jgi:hypothetical protein